VLVPVDERLNPVRSTYCAPEKVSAGVAVLLRTRAWTACELSPGSVTKATGSFSVPTDLMVTGAYRVLFRATYTVSPGAAASAAGWIWQKGTA
jgi:hypothetical protein